ncbi:Ribosomal protein L4 domain [Pseudocohnilembus persalinus]|uniref:Large ribosomal subunit protein uL4m n=1 Tax=Pseudocohnilembus persalinus TaxID=266149 RepID=A0A0V0R7S8_PSEPJ|nr:Ribosomal protein L4 domain [Pseudocohnilembus persalinus]|eukprot:KRX10531.1 Ribosomal protein L4 domain [Pseudocohnilembus persalinus]
MITNLTKNLQKIVKNKQQTNKLLHCFAGVQSLEQIKQFNIGRKQPGEYKLNVKQEQNMPIIYRKPEEQLVQNWWSIRTFETDQPLFVPVFSFQTGEYTGEAVELDHDIFNVPLRRDIIHRVLLWRQNLFLIRTHMARNKATTAGSGKKPSPQKGQGRARRGNKRAGQFKKGGKVHGPKPRIMRYPMNKKVRLQAILTMLSAKLAEGKLRIVDTEQIDMPKTKIVQQYIDNHDTQSRILFIHSYTPDQNFMIAQSNIKRIQVCEPNRLNILKLLKQEKIYITKEALQQLVQDLKDRQFLRYRHRSDPKGEIYSEQQRKQALGIEKQEETRYKYDPSKPLHFKFQILNDYLQEYETVRKEGRLDDYKIKYE